MNHTDIARELDALGTPEKAASAGRFFKSGPGQYGEGDRFLGLSVPEMRAVASKYRELPLDETLKLLASPLHEHRFTALILLVKKYESESELLQRRIYKAYLANARFINNWDLVDCSAEFIVGPESAKLGLKPVLGLAASKSMWERRIAMVSCFYYIKKGSAKEAFLVMDVLEHEKSDLIQKACGWMLREIGKRCGRQVLVARLLEHDRYKAMPRTALRYAIEHFSPEERQAYLKGTVSRT